MSPPLVQPGQFRRVWAMPTMLAVVTVVGLSSALLGEDLAWKALAWALLTVPVVIAAWLSLRPSSSPQSGNA